MCRGLNINTKETQKRTQNKETQVVGPLERGPHTNVTSSKTGRARSTDLAIDRLASLWLTSLTDYSVAISVNCTKHSNSNTHEGKETEKKLCGAKMNGRSVR